MNALAEEHGCLVAYPAQTPAANASKCWNWFSPADQQRDQGEPVADRRHHPPDHARLPGRSAARLCRRALRRRGGRRHHGSDLSRSLRRGRRAFRPGLRGGARHAFGLRRHAAGRGDAAAAVAAGAPGAEPRASCRPSCSMATRTAPCIRATAIRSSPSHGAAGRACGPTVQRGQVPGGHAYSRTLHADAGGQTVLEQWVVHGAGHAWSGGSPLAPTPIREDPMPRARCSASSSSIRRASAPRDQDRARLGHAGCENRPSPAHIWAKQRLPGVGVLLRVSFALHRRPRQRLLTAVRRHRASSGLRLRCDPRCRGRHGLQIEGDRGVENTLEAAFGGVTAQIKGSA